MLKWSPDVFWNSTFYETSCAYIGYCRANGAGRWARRPDGWTKAEIEETMKTTEQVRAENPSGPLPKSVYKQLHRMRKEFEASRGGQ